MHSSTAAAIAALLSGQALAINTWEVAFWSGQDCTSSPVQTDAGPTTPQLSQVCNPIPDLGYTQSFDYEVASGDYSYILGLHKTDDCSDAGGKFQGTPDTPTCEETAGGFTHYSITTAAAISKRDGEIDQTEALNATVSDVAEELEKRQAITFAEFSLAALIPAASWIDKSVTRCSSTKANDDNIQKESCGLSITFRVVFSLISGFGAFGVYQARRNIRQRDEADLENVFTPMGDVAEWLTDPVNSQEPLPQLITGYDTQINPLGPIFDHEGVEWQQFHFNHTHASTGRQLGALLKYNKANGTHIMQSNEQPHTLGKRASTTYTAYYGWSHGASVQSLPNDEETISHLAEQLYNYGKKKNKDQFCADLRGGAGSRGFTRQLTAGNYALLNGIFSDKNGQC